MLSPHGVPRTSQVELRAAVSKYHRPAEAAHHSHYSVGLRRVGIYVAAVLHTYRAEAQHGQRIAAEHQSCHGVMKMEARAARVFEYVRVEPLPRRFALQATEMSISEHVRLPRGPALRCRVHAQTLQQRRLLRMRPVPVERFADVRYRLVAVKISVQSQAPVVVNAVHPHIVALHEVAPKEHGVARETAEHQSLERAARAHRVRTLKRSAAQMVGVADVVLAYRLHLTLYLVRHPHVVLVGYSHEIGRCLHHRAPEVAVEPQVMFVHNHSHTAVAGSVRAEYRHGAVRRTIILHYYLAYGIGLSQYGVELFAQELLAVIGAHHHRHRFAFSHVVQCFFLILDSTNDMHSSSIFTLAIFITA